MTFFWKLAATIIVTGFPVSGVLTSGFGKRHSPTYQRTMFHKGIDVKAKIGTPIFAPAEGVVIFSGRQNGYGNLIIIEHQKTLITKYGHNLANLVKRGDFVSRGDRIATVGQSGRSTGPHLHYEILQNGKAVDPTKYYFKTITVLRRRK